jgi:hypothetical protein
MAPSVVEVAFQRISNWGKPIIYEIKTTDYRPATKRQPPPGGTRLPAIACAARRSEFPQLFQQLVAFRDRTLRIHFRVTDYSLGVQHVGGALVHAALVVENAVSLADRTVWPEIRQQGERNAAQFFGPPLEAGRGVGTELQNFAVQLLEFFVVRTEPVDLVRSAAGKRERHKRDHDRPAAEARERDLLIGVRG